MRSHISLEQFRALCRERGLAFTHQRRVIGEMLLANPGHHSPDEIYAAVREKVPSISLGTVYKNIRTFVETGILREVSVHHGSMKLEFGLHAHHHLVCTRCRTIEDIEETAIEPIRLRGKAPKGFEIQRYSVDILGLCARCRRTNKS